MRGAQVAYRNAEQIVAAHRADPCEADHFGLINIGPFSDNPVECVSVFGADGDDVAGLIFAKPPLRGGLGFVRAHIRADIAGKRHLGESHS